jgi:hypothetical protein
MTRFLNVISMNLKVSCDSTLNRMESSAYIRFRSLGTALGYGLDDRGSSVRFQAGAGNFSLHHRVHNCSGAHPVSYPMVTGGSFSGGKVAGA